MLYHCGTSLSEQHTIDLSTVTTIYQTLRLLFISLLILYSYYLRAGTICGRLLFEGNYYLRATTDRGRLLFEGDYYLRRLLFEGGIYFFGKPGDINDCWIGYEWVEWWWLLDAVSSTRSLSILLLAAGTTRTTWTVLALVWWLLSEIIRTCVRVPCLLAAATIWGQCLFRSRASDCAATIQGRPLFEGGVYS